MIHPQRATPAFTSMIPCFVPSAPGQPMERDITEDVGCHLGCGHCFIQPPQYCVCVCETSRGSTLRLISSLNTATIVNAAVDLV